jgi:hypothetical protein
MYSSSSGAVGAGVIKYRALRKFGHVSRMRKTGNTRRLLVFGLCPSSGILKNTTFRKLDLFPCSGEEVRYTYSVGSVRNRKYIQNLDRETVGSDNLKDETADGRITVKLILEKEVIGMLLGQCPMARYCVSAAEQFDLMLNYR